MSLLWKPENRLEGIQVQRENPEENEALQGMWKKIHSKGQVLEDALLKGWDHGGGFSLQEGILHLRGRDLHEEEPWDKNIQVDCYLLGQEILLNTIFNSYPFKLTIQKREGRRKCWTSYHYLCLVLRSGEGPKFERRFFKNPKEWFHLLPSTSFLGFFLKLERMEKSLGRETRHYGKSIPGLNLLLSPREWKNKRVKMRL